MGLLEGLEQTAMKYLSDTLYWSTVPKDVRLANEEIEKVTNDLFALRDEIDFLTPKERANHLNDLIDRTKWAMSRLGDAENALDSLMSPRD